MDNRTYLVVTMYALMKTLEDETPPEIPSFEGGVSKGKIPNLPYGFLPVVPHEAVAEVSK